MSALINACVGTLATARVVARVASSIHSAAAVASSAAAADAIKRAGLNSDAESCRLLDAHRRAEKVDAEWVADYERNDPPSTTPVTPPSPPTLRTRIKQAAMRPLENETAPGPIAWVLARVVAALRSA